jgi:general secretion pathway protein G
MQLTRKVHPWLLTVSTLALLGFAIWAVFPTVDRGESAKLAAVKSDFSQFGEALLQFRIDTGRYPTSSEGLTALLAAPEKIDGWHGPYIQHPPKDPWANPYIYDGFLRNNAWKYRLASAGPDGKPGTVDDIVNQ